MMRRLRKAQVIGLLICVWSLEGCHHGGLQQITKKDTRPENERCVCVVPRSQFAPQVNRNKTPPAPQPPAPTSGVSKTSAASQKIIAVRAQLPDFPDSIPARKRASSAGSAAPPSAELSPYRVRICAWINGKPLFEGDLYNLAARELAAIMQLPEPERTVKRRELLKEKLEELIDQEVVLQDAYSKLEKNPQFLDKLKDIARKQFDKRIRQMQRKSGLSEFEFKRQLKLQGMSFEAMKRQMERSLIVTEYLRSRVFPLTEKVGFVEIKEYYENHLNEFRTEDRVEWEDIFIAAGTKHTPNMAYVRQFAADIARYLQAGGSIDNVLKYDDGDASTRQGRGYGERRGEIKPPQLEQHLFNMRPGQVGPLVELSTGIHVFRLVKREYARQLPLNEEIQDKIRKKLKSEIAQREFRRIVRELKGQAVIEVDADVLK